MIDVSETKKAPAVSILLLTHDRYFMTKYCLLAALSKAGYSDFELLILDNGSNDQRTAKMCSDTDFPAVQSGIIECLDTNIGIAAGFNQLLRKAKGDYIVFLTNDILLGENWLADMIHYSNEIEHSGLVTIHCEGDKGAFGPLLNTISEFTSVWSPANNITSGVSLISRIALEAVGAFDETLGIYGREREQYAHRLKMLGFKNFYVPGQYSVHLGREISDSDYKKMKEKVKQFAGPRYTASLKETQYFKQL